MRYARKIEGRSGRPRRFHIVGAPENGYVFTSCGQFISGHDLEVFPLGAATNPRKDEVCGICRREAEA